MLFFSDEILTGSIQTPVVKPDLNKANPKLGVGTVNFSANCRYMYSKNGKSFWACLYTFNVSCNYYLRQVNEVNGGDNVFVRCVSVCLCVCAQRTGRSLMLVVVFFNSFRKGPVVCRGLDLDLSGKVAKKTTLTRKRGRHAHNVFQLSVTGR